MNDLTKPEGGEPQYRTLLAKLNQTMSEDELSSGLAYPDETKEQALATQANVLFFFERFGIVLCYDEFALKTYVFGLPGHELLDDEAFDDIYVGMDFTGLRVSKDYLWSVLKSYSRNIRSHPVRDKLSDLQSKWDGKSRLDTWLSDYCGVEDTPYSRAVGAKWMIAAVRRVREPGCKFDHVLIFEGEQGTAKSTIFRELAYGHWFTDNLTIGLDAKEVIELTRGKWIAELAELTNISKKDVESTKHFVTRQEDESRMAYGREPLMVPRQFVLAATTNRTRYLRDESGDRRFWMVATKGVVDVGNGLPMMLDCEGLKSVRDQLWAEAAVREAACEATYLSPDIEALARIEQGKRFDADERQLLLEDLLQGKSGFVPNDDVYMAIGITAAKDKHSGSTKIVTAAMKRLGWTSDKLRVGMPSKQVRGWLSPGADDQVLKYSYANGFSSVSRKDYTFGDF